MDVLLKKNILLLNFFGLPMLNYIGKHNEYNDNMLC